MLYVRVTSIDNPEYNFFNEENKINTSITDASLAVTSYTVDENGYILLPVIGKVKVSDYTLQEAAKVLQEHLKAVLSSPIVSIRFVNNSITVLGEVNNPGTYSYTSEQLNIFKAIGMAGDISEYGNRNEVILIRENGSEIQKRRIDLTKDQVFKSEYYYLRPNDVIYVSPLKIRRFGMKEVPYSLILSVGNTAMVVLVFYLNYINSR
ncbi:MAG: polysaccharide export protein [Flavobacteriales bacterium]|nr:polysaccharide export protein [Flavobacteriales bacterium]MCB9447761.1 polysaccharide export protein [Flavobacteriales bacterium]